MIIIKIIELLSLLFCIKYIYDRVNDKIKHSGLDAITIFLVIVLIIYLIFV